jgi:hypothetical protein
LEWASESLVSASGPDTISEWSNSCPEYVSQQISRWEVRFALITVLREGQRMMDVESRLSL